MVDEAALHAKANADLAAEVLEIANLNGITFTMFLQEVERSNPDLSAARTNVPIAQAQFVAARVYPDPVFQAGYGGDVSNNKQPSAYTAGVAEAFQLPNKVGTRRQVAHEAEEIASAQLQDFIRNLRAQAADVFIDALQSLLVLQQKQKHLNQARELLQTNIAQQREQQIGEIPVLRSRVAELQARGEVTTARSDLQQALRKMLLLMGKEGADQLFRPKGTLHPSPRQFSLNALVAHALAERPDVVAATHSVNAARAVYDNVKAERVPDLTLGGNWAHFTRSTNPIDPSPTWDAAYVSLSISIPVSNLNTGPVQAAYYSIVQADQMLRAQQLRAESEVRSAYDRYGMAMITTEQYAQELLQDTDDVYRARIFGLANRRASLLEALDAHAAVNDVYMGYFSALGDEAKALVALEQAAGIWDIDF